MSGQPYKYASDPEKFRAEYMEALNQQEANNSLNLKANAVYKETGQLPPQSQMKDTRTTAEILADTQKLKSGLIEDFKALGPSHFILSIIQGIEKSPLNADGSLFTYFAQRAPEIATILKKQYKYGIKGDQNDIEKFVSFIEDMYSKSRSITGTVSTYFKTNNVNPAIGTLKATDIESIRKMYIEILKQLLLKSGTTAEQRNNPSSRLAMEISKKMEALESFLNVQTNAVLMNNFFATKFLTDPQIMANFQDPDGAVRLADDFFLAYKEYNDILMKLPKYDFLTTLLERLERSMKNRSNELTMSILTNIDELLPPLDDLKRVKAIMVDYNNTWINAFEPHIYPIQQQIKNNEANQILAREEARRQQPFNIGQQPGAKQLTPEEVATIADLEYDILTNQLDQMNFNNGDPDFHRLQHLIEHSQDEIRKIRGYGLKKGRGRPKGRAKGSGVVKPYAQVVKEKADYDQGIQESPRFVKFGRYLVNQKMLGDGIFSIKSTGGYRIPDVPSTRLSKNLQGVITKMIKGGNLTYDELSTLTEPEKIFLHKVSKKSNIIDKFSIPTPSMDTKDKDIHEFEVMKGEIMAGNDNKDLIKKFKTHILRLSREGTLPKKEVSEIMEILLELGH